MEDQSLTQAAQQLSNSYTYASGKGRKGSEVFWSIARSIAAVSTFGASEIIVALHKLKKNKKTNQYFGTGEGDGQGFTSWQVKNYGLNEDSY